MTQQENEQLLHFLLIQYPPTVSCKQTTYTVKLHYDDDDDDDYRDMHKHIHTSQSFEGEPLGLESLSWMYSIVINNAY